MSFMYNKLMARYPTPLGMIPNELTVLRKKAGLNQAQLAEKLNVDPSVVSHWERGHAVISKSRAAHIRLALDVERSGAA